VDSFQRGADNFSNTVVRLDNSLVVWLAFPCSQGDDFGHNTFLKHGNDGSVLAFPPAEEGEKIFKNGWVGQVIHHGGARHCGIVRTLTDWEGDSL